MKFTRSLATLLVPLSLATACASSNSTPAATTTTTTAPAATAGGAAEPQVATTTASTPPPANTPLAAPETTPATATAATTTTPETTPATPHATTGTSHPAASATGTAPAGGDAVARGHAAFNRVCQRCHEDESTPGPHHNLAWTEARMRTQIRTGSARMRPIAPARLSDPDLADLMAWLRSLHAVQ